MQYLHIVPAKREHIAHVCNNLRTLDKQEIAALHGIALTQASQEAFKQCSNTAQQVYAGINASGEVVTIFGREQVVNIGIGLWLLATDALHSRALLHHTRHLVQQWAKLHPVFCLVWAGQQQSLRFLQHVGFTIHCPTTIHSQTFYCLLYNR